MKTRQQLVVIAQPAVKKVGTYPWPIKLILWALAIEVIIAAVVILGTIWAISLLTRKIIQLCRLWKERRLNRRISLLQESAT